MMRKWNAVISMAIIVLFLIHAIAGGFQLAGIMKGGSTLLSVMAWVMAGLIVIHIVIGTKLTTDTIRAKRHSKVSYSKENKLFIARRISGFAIIIFLLCHVMIFIGNNDNGVYRLHYFGKMQLITQLLLVLSIAVHVITNLKPLFIAFGIRSLKEYAVDILLILSILLVLMGIAFCIYYTRWKIV